MTTTHHEYSPSSLELIELCACFEQRENKDNSASEEGDLMHDACESDDMTDLSSEEQETAVREALAVKKALVDKYGAAADTYNELKVQVHGIDGELLTEGTLDFAVMGNNQEADLADYKFGLIQVTEPENNIQVQSYAVGLFEAFPWLQTIHATIIQPRLNWTATATIRRSDVDAIRLRVATIIARRKSDTRVPTPAAKACAYCGRKGECSALHAVALRAGAGLQLPGTFDPERVATPDDMGKLMVLSTILEDWAKQARKTLTRRVLEEGDTVTGYGVARRSGSYDVMEIYPVVQKVLLAYPGVDMTQVLQTMTASIPKLVGVVSAVAGEPAEVIRDELLALLEEHVMQRQEVVYLKKQAKRKEKEKKG